METINDAIASQGFLYGKLNFSMQFPLFKVFFKDGKWGRQRMIIVLQRILYGV